MTTADRTLCLVTAGWLAACTRAAGALGIGMGLLAALVLAWAIVHPALPLTAGVATAGTAFALLLMLPERVLALRLAFDAGLFAMLADHGHGPAGLHALDAALRMLHLRPMPATPRSLAERVDGARRLSRQHLAVVASQAAALIVALCAALSGRFA